jgi:hypothetical protein
MQTSSVTSVRGFRRSFRTSTGDTTSLAIRPPESVGPQGLFGVVFAPLETTHGFQGSSGLVGITEDVSRLAVSFRHECPRFGVLSDSRSVQTYPWAAAQRISRPTQACASDLGDAIKRALKVLEAIRHRIRYRDFVRAIVCDINLRMD